MAGLEANINYHNKNSHFYLFLVIGLFHALLPMCSYGNPPIIHSSHNMRILKIPVTTKPGTIVYRIKASDADNENVFFDVLEDYGKNILQFDKISPHEANVVLISPLQESDDFNLTIYATDKQESTYIESRLIATSVPNDTYLETNQLNPIILQQNPVYVFENATLNKSIAVVRAFDRDDSRLPVTFELLETDKPFDFHYVFGPRGMSTAELILIDSLDYERQNLYVLTVLAINAQTDEELDTRNVHSVRLSVLVRDVQDSPPVFDNLPQSITLNEPFEKNVPIFNVTARDGDTVNQRNVTFSIVDSNENFRIASNGSVFLTATQDQLTANYLASKPVSLEIQANEIVIDNWSSSNLTMSKSNLLLSFAYSNRAPRFNATHLVGHVPEHSHSGSAVLWESDQLAYVMDFDENLNGTIELSVLLSDGTFVVKPPTAYRETMFALVVNDSSILDFEQRNNFSVMIIAKDKSKKMPLMSNVTCTIYIDDINDNFPQFSQQEYKGAIYENALEGTSIALVETTDRDSGNYGQVRFTTIRGTFAENLKIDPVLGLVTLANRFALDREQLAEMVVTIEARDNLGFGNSNMTELRIQVLDVNDNPPMFLQTSYTVVVDCDLGRFAHPIQVTAIDIDEVNTSNSAVNYEILKGNYEDLFGVDKFSGEMFLKQPIMPALSRSPDDGITLTVRAYDLGVPQLWSTVQLHVYVINRPNTVKALFVTRKKLNELPGNNSLQKYLSDFTGGQVIVTELKKGRNQTEPSSIVASVQYRNESTIDLDAIPIVFDHLVENPEREEKETMNKHIRYGSILAGSGPSDAPNKHILRNLQWSIVDVILWALIMFILLLLFIFVFLLCLIWKERKQNKTVITEHTPSYKRRLAPLATNMSRIKRRKARQKRITNRVGDVSKDRRDVRAMAAQCEKSAFDDDDDERVHKYTASPNMFTYYEFKRMRYPSKPDGPNTVNVLSLHRPQLTNGQTSSHTSEDDELGQRVEQEKASHERQVLKLPAIENGKSQVAKKSEIKGPLQSDSNEQRLGNKLIEFNTFRTIVTPPQFSRPPKVSTDGSSQTFARKSIFTIAYDRVSSRENLTAGSDQVN